MQSSGDVTCTTYPGGANICTAGEPLPTPQAAKRGRPKKQPPPAPAEPTPMEATPTEQQPTFGQRMLALFNSMVVPYVRPELSDQTSLNAKIGDKPYVIKFPTISLLFIVCPSLFYICYLLLNLVIEEEQPIPTPIPVTQPTVEATARDELERNRQREGHEPTQVRS
jgi:hypothetical protein